MQSIIDQLEELKGSLEDLQAEEEEYRDNIPENMQESERYEKADEACDNLSEAVDNLEEVISSICSASCWRVIRLFTMFRLLQRLIMCRIGIMSFIPYRVGLHNFGNVDTDGACNCVRSRSRTTSSFSDIRHGYP